MTPHLFSQRFKKIAKEVKYQKFISILKELIVNIGLVEELKKMTGYEKFTKYFF